MASKITFQGKLTLRAKDIKITLVSVVEGAVLQKKKLPNIGELILRKGVVLLVQEDRKAKG